MNRLFPLLFCVGLLASASGMAQASNLPYDDRADAAADVRNALHEASAAKKDVLLIFGANWCPDCRLLDSVLHGKAAEQLAGRFVLVKVSVGDFDKNLELAKRYDVPLRKGIPAAVVLSSDDRRLYTTQAGELANAHRMGESEIVQFFSRIADNTARQPR